MLQLSLRASRLALPRRSQTYIVGSKRTFVTITPTHRADLIQELYLKELKAYKPNPTKHSDSEGHVQKFSAPKPPRSPEESDMANELKTYEAQQVEVEGQVTGAEASVANDDWFEDDEEEDPPVAH